MERDPYETMRLAMVEHQIAARGIHDPRVLDALRLVPRHLFVPSGLEREAYGDAPLPIGQGQTISQPYIVALMTALLEIGPADRVLEIGAGSGYQAAVLARLASNVITVERLPEVAARARRNLDRADVPNVEVLVGDGTRGRPETAPYRGSSSLQRRRRSPHPSSNSSPTEDGSSPPSAGASSRSCSVSSGAATGSGMSAPGPSGSSR